MKIDTKKIWKYIEWGIVAAIALFVLWYFFLKPIGNANSDIYKAVTKYNDEKVKAIEGERDGYKIALQKTDTVISLIREQIATMRAQLNQSQQTYKRLDAKISDIPNRIAAIADNDDSIRAAFSNYPNK